jgi:hypothetical protein
MNLYLLLAIAFGAITGTTDVPVVRAAHAGVAAECGVRAGEQAIASPKEAHHALRAATAAHAERRNDFARVDAPLAGAATPRAPAAGR